ncbi:MAG: YggU family protein [Candidatus Buchananbacteria bacterium RIFCSPHIGHO2_01_FULL_39_8]|uniref:UPF0235 protein A2731_00670 n=1 Tax=Candidatus Buchananbacteria bacterium RIFCSPHIGHO2_01_FULL_39_8 TaxID=1797533 RepID=A0A1G1XVL8_9BACT|nr:MAG: YggU family protein [Candidatus Buchananbacteria bacterium RIFCSPHIGHO2_01_FULL_39_8]
MTKDILIKVTPGASRDKIIEETENYLKIKIKATPTKGRANKALIKFLAEKYKIPASQIEIIKGLTSRNKLVRIYFI